MYTATEFYERHLISCAYVFHSLNAWSLFINCRCISSQLPRHFFGTFHNIACPFLWVISSVCLPISLGHFIGLPGHFFGTFHTNCLPISLGHFIGLPTHFFESFHPNCLPISLGHFICLPGHFFRSFHMFAWAFLCDISL